MPARTLALLLLSAALLALVPTAGAEEVEHIVYLHEYSGGLHIVPETITAKVGDTLKVTVVNEGRSPHNLIFCGDGTSPLEKCNERWAFTANIPAGESAPLTVTLTKAGTFDYYCDIPGHKSGGMTGVLTVQGEPEKRSVPPPGLVAAALAAAAAALVLRRR